MSSYNLKVIEALTWLLTPSKRGTHYKLAVYLAALESYIEYGGATPNTISHKLGLNSLWNSDIKHWLTQLTDKGLLKQHPGTQIYTPTKLALKTLNKLTPDTIQKALTETPQNQLNPQQTIQKLQNELTDQQTNLKKHLPLIATIQNNS